VGTVLAALGLFSTAAWGAALYYMVHSTLVVAGLFLLSELVAAQRGDAADRLVPASPVAQPALLGLLLLLGAASVAGLPPLSGFIGKLMILQAASAHALQATVWAVVLGAGFLSLLGLARAGSVLFWNVNQSQTPRGASGASAALVGAAFWLLGAGVLMSLLAAPIQAYTAAAAVQLLDRTAYARAVLGVQGEATQSTRPYRGTAGSGAQR
jgi:multicomponent K+:H+ antiporter subunit D